MHFNPTRNVGGNCLTNFFPTNLEGIYSGQQAEENCQAPPPSTTSTTTTSGRTTTSTSTSLASTQTSVSPTQKVQSTKITETFTEQRTTITTTWTSTTSAAVTQSETTTTTVVTSDPSDPQTRHQNSKVPVAIILVSSLVSLVVVVGLVSLRVVVKVRRRRGGGNKRSSNGEGETLLQEFVTDLDTDDWTDTDALNVLENFVTSKQQKATTDKHQVQQAALYLLTEAEDNDLASMSETQGLGQQESSLDAARPSKRSRSSLDRCVVCAGRTRSRQVRCGKLRP